MRAPAAKPSTVRVVVRSTTSRVPFRSGAYSAMLEDEGTNNYAILGTTRGHDTWGQAARAALKLADRRGEGTLHGIRSDRRMVVLSEDDLVHVVERAVTEALGRRDAVAHVEARRALLERRDELVPELVVGPPGRRGRRRSLVAVARSTARQTVVPRRTSSAVERCHMVDEAPNFLAAIGTTALKKSQRAIPLLARERCFKPSNTRAVQRRLDSMDRRCVLPSLIGPSRHFVISTSLQNSHHAKSGRAGPSLFAFASRALPGVVTMPFRFSAPVIAFSKWANALALSLTARK